MSSSVRDDLQSFFAELRRRRAVRQRPAKERRRQKQVARAAPGVAVPSARPADTSPVAVLVTVDSAPPAAPMAADTSPAASPGTTGALRRRLTILVAGGVGGMVTAYRKIVEDAGYRFLYREARSLREMPPSLAWCLVLCTTISRNLGSSVATLAKKRGVSIVYVRNHSLTALREAVEALAQRQDSEEQAR